MRYKKNLISSLKHVNCDFRIIFSSPFLVIFNIKISMFHYLQYLWFFLLNRYMMLHALLQKKMQLYFGFLPKQVWPPSPLEFWNSWGSFLTVNLDTFFYVLIYPIFGETKNYPNSFGMGSLPPFYWKCPKESPKITTPKLLDSAWTPPPF